MVIDGVVGRTAPRVVDFNKMLGPSKWRTLTTALEAFVRSAGRTPSFKVGAAMHVTCAACCNDPSRRVCLAPPPVSCRVVCAKPTVSAIYSDD
jgi:hypothetical protein